MKTSEILELDCRFEKNKKIIENVLMKIKPLSKYSENEGVPIEAIEKVIYIIGKKYKIYLSNITSDCLSGDNSIIWSASIYNDSSKYKVYGLVYGISLYEVLAKSLIKMYSAIRGAKE